jgi:hypothetical protein
MKTTIAFAPSSQSTAYGLAPSNAEAGWYGRGVGVSIRIGPRYGYYGYRYRLHGYYGYRYGHIATVHTATMAIDDTDTMAIGPIADREYRRWR